MVVLGCRPTLGDDHPIGGTEGTVATTEIEGEAGPGETTAMGPDLGPVGCVPQVELSEFELLSDVPFGFMEVFDMDGDGRADLVGGRGVIAFDRGESFEVREVPGYPETMQGRPVDTGRPGEFGGDARPDLLALVSGQIHVFFGGGLDDEAPVVTQVGASGVHGIFDVDGDGVDDIAVTAQYGRAVEIWRGSSDGTFDKLEELPRFEATIYSAVLAQFEPPSVQLAVLTEAGLLHLFEYQRSGLVTVGDPVPGGIGSTFMRRASMNGMDALVTVSDNFYASASFVSLLVRDAEAWTGWDYELGPALPSGVPVAADLDGDGIEDIVVAVEGHIELVCHAAGNLDSCGRVGIPHHAESVAILSTPARIAYSSDEGTWIASVIDVLPCE